ncbi:MAG TPA: hypothetical protein PKL31_15855, partial [Fulvivirga sp.]|nr:hypothetical protein [Fulvivirga sp.]
MRIIRLKFVTRFLSVFFILLFLNSLLAPTITLALTNGPHQPEYTAYEEPGQQDMVDLLTGDFTYRLPAVVIPGPEGGFSMPLSYKAGIGLDQEASWVGLGWSLNAGAITRNVVEYPDDASGEVFQIHRTNDDLARGWTGSIPGIGSIGWNNNDGHTGRLSVLGLVGFSYNNGSVTAGNLFGVEFNKNGVAPNPLRTVSAILTISTYGTASGYVEAAKQAAVQVAIEAAATAAIGVSSPSIGPQGFWKLSKSTDKRLFYTNYKYYLDQTRYEDMYGVLHLGEMKRYYYDIENPRVYTSAFDTDGVTPVYLNDGANIEENGAASDMYYDFDGTSSYVSSSSPTSLAKDRYSVMGPGISGSIEPYRLDIGTLSFPRQMKNDHVRIAMLPWKSRAWPESYKPQFRYRSSTANAYYHHVGGTGTSSNYTFDLDNINFGIEHEVNSNSKLAYRTSDPSLPEYYNFGSSGAKTEAPREGLSYLGLSQEKNVEWYTNNDIITGNATGFMDCFSTQGRETSLDLNSEFGIAYNAWQENTNTLKIGVTSVEYLEVGDFVRIDGKALGSNLVIYDFNLTNIEITEVGTDYLVFDADIPDYIYSGKIYSSKIRVNSNTIGGYSITREDGQTYHYALPIYDWNDYTYIEDVNDADNVTTLNRMEPFPSAWLLTSITGSDFVDRNENGQVDEEDWGYWVKFDYGKFSNNYQWRTPYEGMIKSDDGESWTYQSGQRQQYYLNSIQTRTHMGLFIKDVKLDGRDADVNAPSSSMLLDEFVLLKNQDYESLVSMGFSPGNNTTHTQLTTISDNMTTVIDKDDFTPLQRNYLYQNQLARVKFNYDYSLAKNTTNSFSISSGVKTGVDTIGKLTLNSISIYGRNNIKTAPDYLFFYGYNPEYDKDKWDGWGYYNSNGTSAHDTHQSSNIDQDGYAWSLNKVTNPLGNDLEIEYERDRYTSISGNSIPEKKGEGIRVKSIQSTNGIQSFKTRYEYTNSGVSSGVVAQEPAYIKQTDYDFYGLFDYPSTPVLYSVVNVFDGKNTNNTDYHTKQVYEFITPNQSMITKQENILFDDHVNGVNTIEYLQKSLFNIDIKSSSIGKPSSINIFDNNDLLKFNTSLIYSDDLINSDYPHQGVFTEGSFLIERVEGPMQLAGQSYYNRVFKTVKRYYPSVLSSIESTNSDGFTTTQTNKEWDFKTGIVKATEVTSALGIKTRTEKVLTHEVYPEMGFKQEDRNNLHMVAGTVATYVYKLNSAGVKTGLIGAATQTWRKDWDNYRMVNSSGDYEDVDNGYPRWRKSASYVYQGQPTDLKSDGTLTFNDAVNKFDFNGAENTGWLKSNELLRFDNYSMPLESVDFNGIYSSTKTDIASKQKILEAGNAKYTEVAFSGAENNYDIIENTRYVEGEIRISTNAEISDYDAHTGKKSLKIYGNGTKGFFYKTKAGDFDPSRNYRLNVWVKNAPSRIELYYKLGSSTVILNRTEKQAGNGDWYRLEAIIPSTSLNGTDDLEVGCRSTSSTATYLDDFRFQPIDAGTTAYVYDEQDQLRFMLDNENLFTEYEYNDRGL